MAALSAGSKRILDGKNLAHVATLMPDGSPQITPVWVDHDGDYVLINTCVGRLKERNLRRDQRVAISVVSNDDPNDVLFLRGRVVEFIEHEQGALAHINKMAKKYADLDTYPWLGEGERRVMFKIEADRVQGPEA